MARARKGGCVLLYPAVAFFRLLAGEMPGEMHGDRPPEQNEVTILWEADDRSKGSASVILQ